MEGEAPQGRTLDEANALLRELWAAVQRLQARGGTGSALGAELLKLLAAALV
jgi:hypothetical protein